MFQTVRWMPFSNTPYYNCRMSQYGSNHSHYQTISSVASDKPWDIVAAAAAAAAANVGHNIKTSVGTFPNGFQATVVNGSSGELPSGGNASGYFNAGQNPNHHSPSWASEAGRLYASGQQQQWANVAGEQYHQRHSSAHHSQQYNQHHVLQQQTQLSAASSNAPSSAYFASARLTSPASSPTGWPKLPHQSLIHVIDDDDSSSSQQLKFEPHHHYPPQQSPTYLSRSVDAHSSYNSLLAASAGLNQLPQNQLLRHQNYQPSNNAVYQQQGRVPDVRQNAPLYHSSLELEMLRTFAAANSSKKPDRENASLMNFSPPQRQPNYLHPSPSASPRSAALSAYLTANHSGNIKSEPCLSPRLNSSEMEAVKTMLSIQTNLVKENSLAGCEYQQISPAASDDSATDELRLNCGYNNSLAKPSSFQISRDEARAQQNTDVPAIDVALVNNNESSSISTSAKFTQEYKKTVATDKSDNRKDRLLPLDRSPLSKEVRADSVEETSKGEIDVENPAHNSYPSGISVVSKNCSVGASLPVLGSPDPSSGNKGQQKLESECNSTDSSCSSPENRNASSSPSTVLGTRLSPLSSMSSRSESTPSKSAISGYGLQHRNASGYGIVYNCHICKFSCLSKFHFNSHMNTHADHKCTFCDYTSRTEGRLKRHMKDFHTHSTDAEDYGGKLIIHEGDDSNRCSPPSPDENTALIEREVMAVVSAATSQSSEGHSPSGSQSNKQTTSNKPKNYRCKQCTFVATSKTEFWLHQKSAHIKGDRVLSCSRCLFVTEYKHHLEYHLRNHFGSKPFKCTKCNYSCVNKSMLNSHMKSHSNFYQYRCDDCTYATKYCHSLKMHLRKYAHRPASVINPDGSTSEPSVIDVYGNRRGPRTRKNHGASQGTPPVSSSVPSITALLPPMTVPPVLNGVGGMSSGGPSSLTPLMEALQTSYLKQQQELATAMATSIATLGAQLPTVPSSMPMNDSNLIDDGMPMLPTSSALKCNMCNFETNDGKDVLTVHVMTHIIKKDLCNLYNLESTTVAASASTNSNSSTPNERLNNGYSQTVESTLGRVSSSTPKDEARSRSSSFVAHFGQASSNSPSARISPSQEISQDSNSPASASYGKHSGDESVGGVEAMPHSSRRKGKAYKLDKIALRLQERVSPMTPSSKEDEAELLDATDNALRATSQHSSSSSPSNKRQHSPVAVSCPKRLNSHASNASASNETAIVEAESEAVSARCNHTAEPTDIDWSNAYVCNYCEIAFKDCIMYTIHMGYHGFRDPFKCNMCGHVSDGRLSMFLHIARVPHP